MTGSGERRQVECLGFLCIQGYPRRICLGCTSACSERAYVEVEASDDGVKVPSLWLSPDEVARIKLARDEGYSHLTLQVRIDRHDDTHTVCFGGDAR